MLYAMERRSVEQRFRLVADTADALNRHPMVVGKAGIQLQIKFDAAGVSVTRTEPDEMLLTSILPTLRKFLLERDDHQLTGVHKLAIRHIEDPELVHAIESAKVAYQRERDGFGVKININGKDVTPEYAADLWINGVYLHSNLKEEEELRSLTGVAPHVVRYFFLDFMVELTKNAIWTGSVLREALDRGVVREGAIERARAHPHGPRQDAVAPAIGGEWPTLTFVAAAESADKSPVSGDL